MAQNGPPSNLTQYLLTKYASRFDEATNGPAFFHQVLNGTVEPARVAYFFEQDTIYGRGFLTLVGNTLGLLTADLEKPESAELLQRVDNLGQTASGLSDEGGKLSELRDELEPGSNGTRLCPSAGAVEYVEYMKSVSSSGDGFAAFVCSWTMGKAFVDVWQGIQANQVNKPNKIPQLQQIIDYWADPSYAASIDSTRDLVNTWYAENTTSYLPIAEKIFVETLDAEDAFWKSVDAWNG